MPLAIQLDPLEARILGVLIEKEYTTPEQYPLSLHALVTGCNQKSNRDPEMSVSEHEVSQAILRLRVAQLVEFVQMSGQRVEKYRQRAGGVLHLEALGLAVLAELLMRGAQQPNELARRVERMQPAATPEQVQATLDALRREELATLLERRSGERYARWAQLLAPVADARAAAVGRPRPDVGPDAARIAAEVAAGHPHAHAPAPAHDRPAQQPSHTAPVLTGLRAGVLTSAPHAARPVGAAAPDLALRVTALEAEVADLRARLDALSASPGGSPTRT